MHKHTDDKKTIRKNFVARNDLGVKPTASRSATICAGHSTHCTRDIRAQRLTNAPYVSHLLPLTALLLARARQCWLLFDTGARHLGGLSSSRVRVCHLISNVLKIPGAPTAFLRPVYFFECDGTNKTSALNTAKRQQCRRANVAHVGASVLRAISQREAERFRAFTA